MATAAHQVSAAVTYVRSVSVRVYARLDVLEVEMSNGQADLTLIARSGGRLHMHKGVKYTPNRLKPTYLARHGTSAALKDY